MPTQPPGFCCTFLSVMAKFFAVESFISATLPRTTDTVMEPKVKTTFLSKGCRSSLLYSTLLKPKNAFSFQKTLSLSLSLSLSLFHTYEKRTSSHSLAKKTKQKKRKKESSFLFPLGTQLQNLTLTYGNKVQ